MGLLNRNRKRSSLFTMMVAWTIAGGPLLVLCGLLAGATGSILATYLYFSADLPKIPDLKAYRPKTVSYFYAQDGTVTGIFYHEKRFPVSIKNVPPHVINAFLAAEDVFFFQHPGVDWRGILRAAVRNVQSGGFGYGGSTITQQVIKNFVLTKEKKVSRKVREALLSFRLEKALSKQEILELYLNQICLGSGAYGVESAARTYFGKTCSELTIGEAALLAGLVPRPSEYSPKKNLKLALTKKNLVLDNMIKYGFISQKQYDQAHKEVPTIVEEMPNPYSESAPYFTEAVRRYIVDKYGEERLYNEGLKVYTTCDLTLQQTARKALMNGAVAWEQRQRRPRGLIKNLTKEEVSMFLQGQPPDKVEVGALLPALVVQNHTPKKRRKKKGDADSNIQECTLALSKNMRFKSHLESKYRYRPNDVVMIQVTEVKDKSLTLEQYKVPPIQGALVCIENQTGYVKALVGGLDFKQSSFNRAVQAKRQPGSSFKPFVYSAALEWGHYSPFTTIVDEPMAVIVPAEESEWIPMNSDGQFLGPISVRRALALSRNTAAAKVIMDIGAESVVRMARNMGIESYLGSHLSLALGASEVTPLEMTAAYSVFPNMGMRVYPVLVKKVVDRFGNVLEDNTTEPLQITPESLSTPQAMAWLRERTAVPTQQYEDISQWQGDEQFRRKPEQFIHETTRPLHQETNSTLSTIDKLLSMPISDTLEITRRPDPFRVISPQAAHLMVNMLQAVCVAGTAAKASKLGRKDLGGKTGTTDDCTDAWFLGFNPKYTTGVWIGFDIKQSLGRKEYGSTAALPIWMEFMGKALEQTPSLPYTIPPGLVWNQDQQQVSWDQTFDMLSAGPDLPSYIHTKSICSVDGTAEGAAYPSSFYPNHGYYPGYNSLYPTSGYYSGYFPSQDNTGPSLPGSVKVFSHTGETLGYAPLTQDEDGKLMLYKEELDQQNRYQQQPQHNDMEAEPEYPRQGSFQSAPSRAAQFFRNLRNFFNPNSRR